MRFTPNPRFTFPTAGLPKLITVQQANVDAAIADFPLLVRVTDDAELGAVAAADGHDVVFKTLAGTVLPFERISFSVTGGLATGLFRVKLSIGATTTDSIVMDVDPDGDDLSSPTTTYDSAVKGHWNLDDSAASVSSLGYVKDSTGNHNLTATGTVSYAQAAKEGLGVSMAGTGALTTACSADQYFTGDFTIALWVKWLGSPSTDWWQWAFIGCSASNNKWMLSYSPSDGKFLFHWTNSGGSGQFVYSDSYSITTGTWYHVAVTRSGNTWTLYVNGTPAGTSTNSANFSEPTTALFLGTAETYGLYLNGVLDDVFLIKGAAKSAAWVKFLYHNTYQSDSEITFSATTPDTVELTGEARVHVTAPASRWLYLLRIDALNCDHAFDGASSVALSSLSVSEWQALLKRFTNVQVAAADTSLYALGLTDAEIAQAWDGYVYGCAGSALPTPDTEPYGWIVGQTLAELCQTNPAAALALMR